MPSARSPNAKCPRSSVIAVSSPAISGDVTTSVAPASGSSCLESRTVPSSEIDVVFGTNVTRTPAAICLLSGGPAGAVVTLDGGGGGVPPQASAPTSTTTRHERTIRMATLRRPCSAGAARPQSTW